MGLLSFRGGIHPPHSKKSTEQLPIVKAAEPKIVSIPLRQHIGAPCEAMVKKGDAVKVGQKIGEAKAFVCAPVHSSVSGTVIEVVTKATLGGKDLCVVIENDGLNTLHEDVKSKGDLDSLSSKEILGIIKEAGIVGMGGAGFPTHVKLSPPPEKKIDVVILNGAECEPYLTADHRLMLENPEYVIYGIKCIMKSLNVTTGFIGIEDNKPEVIKKMTEVLGQDSEVKVVGLRTKYPQGAEKQLIFACTGREVPSGALPMDAGAVVNNVATAVAVANAVKHGMPLVERVCTITGAAINKPQNLLIKVGTNLNEIIEQCDGFKGVPGKVIMGGPMMGLATDTLDIPSTKTTSGILCFSEAEAKIPEPSNCIKCGKCVSVCPSFVQPAQISAYALKDMFDLAEESRALDCIECGSCSFVCPSKRPLLQSIRVAKREILAKRRKAK